MTLRENNARDRAAEEYLENECYAMDGYGPHRDTYKAGWDACLAHLLKSAPEFDEAAALAEYDKVFVVDPDDTQLMYSRRDFIDGRAHQHAQMSAQVAALRDQNSTLKWALRRAMDWLDRLAVDGLNERAKQEVLKILADNGLEYDPDGHLVEVKDGG